MTEIISVRFPDSKKSYYFNPNGLKVSVGEEVMVETGSGLAFGKCTEGNRMIDERELVSPLRPILRRATKEDYALLEEKKKIEEQAFEVCQEKIEAHGLDMKLIKAERSLDGSKLLFFFTADGRVDFRALVRDLAAVFHTRIELRQIGVRDEARMLGGIGICGRPYCCASYMSDFHPVSIKMAKTQNLSLNPAKISGACGRLMCCLQYEQDAYEDLVARTPKLNSLVETPDGVGTVNAVQMMREKVEVKLDKDPDSPRTYSCDDVTVIHGGKDRRPADFEEAREKPPAVLKTEEKESRAQKEETRAPADKPKPRPHRRRTGKGASAKRAPKKPNDHA